MTGKHWKPPNTRNVQNDWQYTLQDKIKVLRLQRDAAPANLNMKAKKVSLMALNIYWSEKTVC